MSDASLTLSCNQSGASFTTKSNDALAAINSMRSGALPPTNNLVDGVLWLDTSSADNVVKIRIGNTWHTLFDFDGSNFYAEFAERATMLQNTRTFSISGDVEAAAVNFNGEANVVLATEIKALSVVAGDHAADQDLSGKCTQIGDSNSTEIRFDSDSIDFYVGGILRASLDTNGTFRVVGNITAADPTPLT